MKRMKRNCMACPECQVRLFNRHHGASRLWVELCMQLPEDSIIILETSLANDLFFEELLFLEENKYVVSHEAEDFWMLVKVLGDVRGEFICCHRH